MLLLMFPVVLSNIKKIIFIGGDALELCLGAQALRRYLLKLRELNYGR